MSEYRFFDLTSRSASTDISTLFPGWASGDERVLVLSPHDDDALLGGGYAMQACREHGAEVYVCVLCDGRAGYSTPEERESIVQVRIAESRRAYAAVGVDEQHLVHLGYPDFSLRNHVGLFLAGGQAGAMRPVVALLRRARITRVLIPNGYREHSDHQAAFDIGRYDSVQAGDQVAVDWAPPYAVKSVLQYSVWGDFDPEDALLHGRDARIRANLALIAPLRVEEQIARALAEWRSQGQIIADLLRARRKRDCGCGLLELYIAIDPRPALDYGPYVDLVRTISPD
ncbi:MAG: PIG-L family deacetylase [Chloroflexi bacterium]|nr:PIG-L family deacetylase [Chloroflexota bacterium]